MNLNILKIGTSTITDEYGVLKIELINSLANQIKILLKQERFSAKNSKFLIVSSGAIGCGMNLLKIKENSLENQLPLSQSCAAVGQSELMKTWKQAFKNMPVSQHLITSSVFEYKNNKRDFINCLEMVLKLGCIPIINENDVISTEEIDKNFTDNDGLASLLCEVLRAERLIILSDIQGLYDSNPFKNPNAKIIPRVSQITDEVMKMADGKSNKGRGGMNSKLKSIAKVNAFGTKVFLTKGDTPNSLLNVFEEDFRGTIFGD